MSAENELIQPENGVAALALMVKDLAEQIGSLHTELAVTRHLAFCAVARAPNRLEIVEEFRKLQETADAGSPTLHTARIAEQVEALAILLTKPQR